MWCKAVVWPSLDGQPYALGAAMLPVLYRFPNGSAAVPAQCIVQAPDKPVPVVCRQRHEGTTHENEFHLHGTMRSSAKRQQGLLLRMADEADGEAFGSLSHRSIRVKALA